MWDVGERNKGLMKDVYGVFMNFKDVWKLQ
jgi:hypothetical protein